MRDIDQLKKEVDIIKYETELIREDVDKIKDKLIDHTPEKFSKQDFIRSSIGALFLGFSVLFSGNLITISNALPGPQLYIIILGTIAILTLEIYIIGYSRVKDKARRTFGQFWLKRVVAFYITAISIATILAFTFGMQYIVGLEDSFVNLIIVLSAPCAIGASLGDLLKKY